MSVVEKFTDSTLFLSPVLIGNLPCQVGSPQVFFNAVVHNETDMSVMVRSSSQEKFAEGSRSSRGTSAILSSTASTPPTMVTSSSRDSLMSLPVPGTKSC